MTDNTILSGRNEIRKYLGRSWKTIQAWIEMGAPIAKLEGRWESDSQQLLEWRRSRIASNIDVCQLECSSPRHGAASGVSHQGPAPG